jgi:hypothetical protein
MLANCLLLSLPESPKWIDPSSVAIALVGFGSPLGLFFHLQNKMAFLQTSLGVFVLILCLVMEHEWLHSMESKTYGTKLQDNPNVFNEGLRENTDLWRPMRAMNSQSNLLDNVSTEATTPDRILQIVLGAWRQRNFVAVANQFSDQFTSTDQALGLEFKDKGACPSH